MLRAALVFFTAGTLLLYFGCSAAPEYGEVEGIVTLDKQPAANLHVVFMPDPELGTRGPSSDAFTDAQGRYHLVSRKGRDGVVVGLHRVCIHDAFALAEAMKQAGKGDSGEKSKEGGGAQKPTK